MQDTLFKQSFFSVRGLSFLKLVLPAHPTIVEHRLFFKFHVMMSWFYKCRGLPLSNKIRQLKLAHPFSQNWPQRYPHLMFSFLYCYFGVIVIQDRQIQQDFCKRGGVELHFQYELIPYVLFTVLIHLHKSYWHIVKSSFKCRHCDLV